MSETPNDFEQFGKIVEAVKDYAVFLLDTSGHVKTWNAGAERIKGYKSNEIIGRHFSIFYPEDLLAVDHPQHELDIVHKEGRYEEIGKRKRKDGTEFWASITLTAVKDHNGTLQGYAKITQDITDRKRAEEHLQQSEERLRLLIEAVKDYAIFMVDLDGKVASWNAGAHRLNGYTADEIIGRPLAVFYTPDAITAGYPRIEFETAMQEGRFEEEGLRVRKDGSTYWATIVLTALRDDKGELRGFAKVTRDITERKQAEHALWRAHSDLEKRVEQRTAELVATVEQLQSEIKERKKIEQELIQSKEMAQAANKAKSAFLANMSHEIRTPLGAVLGFSELLQHSDLTEEERTLYLETVQRNGDALLTIINDILDLSKVDSGTFQVNKELVDLHQFIADIAMSLGLKADEKGLELLVQAEGSLPDSMSTDPVRLKQILFNIIGNAIKFTSQGSVLVNVRMIATVAGDSLLTFDVTDTGPGISAESMQHLFEPFMQVDPSLTRKHGGTGLGLALSRRLAQALGGDVVLRDSIPGSGSTFTITVQAEQPVHKSLMYRNLGGKSKGKSQEQVHPINGRNGNPKLQDQPRVLLVEDLPDNRLLVISILNKLGIAVDWAENGVEGIQKALHGTYDVVLMDLQMPVMDGYAAVQELRRLGFAKPIVALSAHALRDDKARAAQAGFNDYITKPVSQQNLRASLRDVSSRIKECIG